MTIPDRPRVVIIGAGFAGLWAARSLSHSQTDVLLLDRNNYHTFFPLLYQVAAGELEPEDIVYPVRSILRGQQNVRFLMNEVTGIDLAAKLVKTTDHVFPYDFLVLAIGSTTHFRQTTDDRACHRSRHCGHNNFPAPHSTLRSRTDETTLLSRWYRRRVDRHRRSLAIIFENRQAHFTEEDYLQNIARSSISYYSLFCCRFQIWMTVGRNSSVTIIFRKEFNMSQNTWWGRPLQIFGIVLMGLTAAFTLLGGAGTTCVAINPTGFGESMAPLAKFQWLYVLFVLAGIAIGVWGIRATIKLIKGTSDSYLTSIKALVAGVAVGGFHIYASRLLRGKSMPVDAVVYTTILTLAIFLIFRIPGIWQGVNFDKGSNSGNTGGLAAAITLILVGISVLALPFVMAETHTFVAGGINWAAIWSLPLNLIGLLLIVDGLGWLALFLRPNRRSTSELLTA